MATGYCTVEDVRRALRKNDLPGDATQDRDIVIDAIKGTTQWLQKTTDCHFYESGGISEDSDNLVPTAVKSRGPEAHDIPSTPHPGHTVMRRSGNNRYAHKTHGPYCRVGPLEKRDADELTKLEIRDNAGDFTDWVADSGYSAGDDYELFVEPGSAPSRSYINIRATALPAMELYNDAVRASYDYGENELPGTVRRAVAFKAAGELADDPAFDIPDTVQVQSVESLTDMFDRKAEEKLEPYT